jgi:hypothetical protein
MLLTEKHEKLLESEKYAKINEADLGTTALVLENQEQEMVRLTNEGTLVGDVQDFVPVFMPLARRVYPNLIANDLVGIQPMKSPTGYIYSMSNRYTGSGTNSISPTTKGQILEVASTTLNVADTDTCGANKAFKVIYKETYASGMGSTKVRVLIELTDASPANIVAGDTITGTAESILGAFSNEAQFNKILKNYSGSYATGTAEGMGYDVNEMGFEIKRKQIEAESRKLKGEYSLEMYQDLKAVHGKRADEEIMSLMGYELQTEIDREIIDFVNESATQVADFNMGGYGSTVGTNSNEAAGTPTSLTGEVAMARWEIEKYRVAGIKLAAESREIARLTRRGPANRIVVSPAVATMLEQLDGYKDASISSDVNPNSINTSNIGTFAGKKVIMDNFAEYDYATLLYKGNDRRDAIGYYAPYVPASFQRITHEASGQPGIILSTRASKTTNPINPESYGRHMAIDFGASATKTLLGAM